MSNKEEKKKQWKSICRNRLVTVFFLISSCNLYDVMWRKKMSEVGMEEANRPVAGIRPPPPLCLEDNLSANWKLFKLKWHNYAIITYLTRQVIPIPNGTFASYTGRRSIESVLRVSIFDTRR